MSRIKHHSNPVRPRARLLEAVLTNRGMAAVVALLMIGMLTLIGLAALSTSDSEMKISGNELQDTRVFYSSEAGLETGTATVLTQYETTGMPPTTLPSGSVDVNGCSVSWITTDGGPVVVKKLSSGTLSGLNAYVKTYTITSDAVDVAMHARVVLEQNLEATQIPIFQFAVFYNDDLQASPLPNMTLNGRVHANGNVYLQTFAQLKIDSYLSSAGNIYHGLKYSQWLSSATGGVFIKDKAGLYENMKQASGWLDSRSADWYTKASALWGGKVQDKAFGQSSLNLPLAGTSDPHKLVERETGNVDSYELKSTLKFVNGKAFKKVSGLWTDVTSDMTTKGIITVSNDEFHDAREVKNVDVLDLDVAKLYDNGYAPANGVLYYSGTYTGGPDFPALRMKNAATLGAPLTVVSQNPVYTVGDFNSLAKKPAAIMADALTILSSSWDDTKGTLAKNQRQASNTILNASFITGDKDPNSANYQGGLENLPRFLEYWGSTKTCTIRGSMVNLWNARQSTGDWSIDYYEPPVRDWAYDTDLDDPSKQPPETPKVLIFNKGGWKQHDIQYEDRIAGS